jgi:hypothetical protein
MVFEENPMQISRVSIPLAAMLLAGCAHSAGGNAHDVELPPAPVTAPAPLVRGLPPAPSLSEAPVPAPVDAPRPARSAVQRSAQ